MSAINLRSGTVELGGMIVTPSLDEDSFVDGGTGAELLIHNGIFRSYKLPHTEIAGRAFVPSVWFENGRLARLTLDYYDPDISGWDGWTEQAMKAAHCDNEKWLNRQLGRWGRRRFDWGRVGAFADPRGGSASIVLSFGS